MGQQLIFRDGQMADACFRLVLTPEVAGWRYSGLRVIDHDGSASTTFTTGQDEVLILPLTGGCTVTVEDQTWRLTGRGSVFEAVTDYLYLPPGLEVELSSTGGRFAVGSARARATFPVQYCSADQVRTELRGAADCSRQVNNYALANPVQTDHLLVCEVLTPGGNWSSYPPHKHDEHTQTERELEEIYYFRVRPGADGSAGFAFHATYGEPGRPIDVCTLVRDGDLALVPHGYHGPCVAAPGYDLYYLNVMAGPAEDRQWLMNDDPDYAWVRGTWPDQQVDPRLPMTGPTGKQDQT